MDQRKCVVVEQRDVKSKKKTVNKNKGTSTKNPNKKSISKKKR